MKEKNKKNAKVVIPYTAKRRVIDLQKEFEEDQEFLRMLSNNDKKNDIEIIPELDESKMQTQTNFANQDFFDITSNKPISIESTNKKIKKENNTRHQRNSANISSFVSTEVTNESNSVKDNNSTNRTGSKESAHNNKNSYYVNPFMLNGGTSCLNIKKHKIPEDNQNTSTNINISTFANNINSIPRPISLRNVTPPITHLNLPKLDNRYIENNEDKFNAKEKHFTKRTSSKLSEIKSPIFKLNSLVTIHNNNNKESKVSSVPKKVIIKDNSKVKLKLAINKRNKQEEPLEKLNVMLDKIYYETTKS